MASRSPATLREYAYPRLAGKGVDEVTTTEVTTTEVTTTEVIAVLLPIWTRKHATASRCVSASGRS